MKRYTVRRGKRSARQYDLMIYDANTMIFRGSFCNGGDKLLNKHERMIRQVISDAIESLNNPRETQ